MKHITLSLFAVSVVLSSGAVDLSELSDIRFAESYAFSTNRAALIATLRPNTKAWFTYSILDAQVSGRLDDAEALLDKWKSLEGAGSPEWDHSRFLAMRDRQYFLRYDTETAAGKSAIWRVRQALDDVGIKRSVPSREVELKPNTYPSALDQKDVSYDAFRMREAHLSQLDPKFRFITFLEDPECVDEKANESAARDGFLPDTPGMFEHLLAYMKSGDPERHRFQSSGTFPNLTLAQLDALAKALKDDPRRSLTGEITRKDSKSVYHRRSDEFARTVLEKLVSGADADPDDFAEREAVLKRRIAFAESLGEGMRNIYLLPAMKDLLALYSEFGLEDDNVDLFWKYLKTYGSGHAMDGDELIGAYICACRKAARAKNDFRIASFMGYVDCRFYPKVTAEFDLVSGVPASEVDTGALSSEEFKEIQERVELKWAKSNRRVFALSDDLSLAIDVKNVPKMRIAIYELDAAAACRVAKGEVASDIDLDCAVPTVERTIDYSSPSVIRHRETLAFPELKEPGLYVVECSGQGVASRALVRKGRLRATERRDAAGHVFAALDEEGKVVKGAKLWLDGTVFKADESGEISVPFATTGKSAGRKTAVVSAGRLATAVSFDHATESHSLQIAVVLPPESLVAGREATALVRPVFRTSGTVSTVKIVEKPLLTVTFTDVRGRTSVKKFPAFELFDDAESVCKFKVPGNLSSVEFTLEGTVRRASGGDDERLSATWSRTFNGISRTSQVEQLFLRRTSEGYILECRGRTGETIPHRAVKLAFSHRAFADMRHEATLQGDANGVVKLGALADICRVSTKDFGGYTWKLDCGVKWPYGAKTIASAEGEAIELPVRGLFEGAWPGADRLDCRVSLLAVNKDGKYTEDCIEACSYSNGVLRIERLLAGDYRLRFRTENIPPVEISVVKTGRGVGEGGVVAGAARAVTDTGAPGALRIGSAEVSADGALRVKLAGAGADARVHVFAARTFGDSREGPSPFAVLAGAIDKPAVMKWKWSDPRSKYVSGRDLGDKLRYIFDRRQEKGRIGNMLDRPSLLLNPWTTSETDTEELSHSYGEAWADAAAPGSASKRMNGTLGAGHYGDIPPLLPFVCRDFLPSPGLVVANVRPDGEGRVSVDLSKAAGMQDVSVVVTDGRAMDVVRLVGAAAAFAPRDLRVKKGFDAIADSGRTKSYSTVGELYDLLYAIMLKQHSCAQKDIRDFGFLAEWDGKSEEERRALYGKYASHELNFFLYEKDRAFFDAVVAPHLRNKRRKEFMDRWLLGEDVSEYAVPGRLQDLNALEQCLLARRDKSVAKTVARMLADWCEANPASPDDDDLRLSIALGETMENQVVDVCCEVMSAPADAEAVAAVDMIDADEPPQRRAVGADMLERRAVRAEMLGQIENGWSSQRSLAPSQAPLPQSAMALGSVRASGAKVAAKRRSAEMKRRSERQFWRPPERTKEWVESHWYKGRPGSDTLEIAPPSRFWRDYAAAIAEGKEAEFRSAAIVDTADWVTDMVAALAVARVGFAAKDGEAIVFSRGGAAAGGETVRVERHFFDALESNDDGSPKEVTDEFVCGTAYMARTIVMNPTAQQRRVRVVSQLPEGAFPLSAGFAAEDASVVLPPYGVETLRSQEFYFPFAGEDVGRAAAAVAVERGVRAGASGEAVCNVVAESSKSDTASWRYVSQKATKGEVLDYLKTKNLANVDLAKAGWRFIDGDFAKKAVSAIEGRGAYCQALWLAGLQWKDAFDARRIREALSRRENRKRLAEHLGPVFRSSLVEIEPEESDIFEHREYWPMINARTHAKGGAATIANSGLKKTYREFLDTLAAKGSLSAADRLLAAVYLVSQDRIPEAEAQAGLVQAADVETKMQLDYLKAYLAFSRGDAREGRAIAVKWKDAATPLWRGRFREVLAQADEIIEGDGVSGGRGDGADAAPSIALKAEAKDGVPEGVVITARNLASCTLKAYPVDVEIGFSKDPFGQNGAVSGGILGMKPAWTQEVALDGAKESRVALPKGLRKTNLVIVASGADGGAEERLELTPGALDVQVASAARQLRVRGADGRPVAGAYVKVYARDVSGRETKFHKDGYTDMRGAFDYESVSTDTEFRPAEFAVFVQGSEGVRTLRVQAK